MAEHQQVEFHPSNPEHVAALRQALAAYEWALEIQHGQPAWLSRILSAVHYDQRQCENSAVREVATPARFLHVDLLIPAQVFERGDRLGGHSLPEDHVGRTRGGDLAVASEAGDVAAQPGEGRPAVRADASKDVVAHDAGSVARDPYLLAEPTTGLYIHFGPHRQTLTAAPDATRFRTAEQPHELVRVDA